MKVPEAARELHDLFATGDAPLILLDPQSGGLIDANPAAEAFYGWSVAEFRSRGLTLWDVSATDAHELREVLARISEGSLTRVLATHRTADGTPRRVEIYCGPLRVAERACLYGIVFDLERRERGVSAEEKLRALIEQPVVGIYMIEEGRFSYVNPRTAEIFGYRVEELLGKPVLELVHDPDRQAVAENLRRRMEGTVRSARYEFHGIRKDGAMIDIGVHGAVAVIRGKPLVVGVLQDITERRRAERAIHEYVQRLERATMGAVDAIVQMVELRDPYTAGHQHRVGVLAAAIGKELAQSEETIKGLEIAGHVHDIGKINVPAEILTKPAKLSHPEFAIIQTHAGHGGDILKNIDFPWPLAAVARQHHERLDGTGYPDALRGDAISPEARILAVADVIEAMASHRPYRASLGMEPALAEIERHAGTRYDASVVQACLRLFRERAYSLPL